MTNDTGVLTICPQSQSTEGNHKANTLQKTLEVGQCIELDFNYADAIDGSIEKMDEHICAYVASEIEKSIVNTIKRCTVRDCQDCLTVFGENIKVVNAFINRKNATARFHIPCQSTVNIVKATNEILNILADEQILSHPTTYNNALRTIINHIDMDDLYDRSLFSLHNTANHVHKEEFIFKVISEYLKMKSHKIGTKISEEERGRYIRHNNRKRVHEQGQ